MNIFENSFHSEDDLRLKNHSCEIGDSSILDHLCYEKVFQKYSFNRKISNKVYRWLTLKGSKKHQKIFHSDYDLGSKNHSCENGN